MCNLRGSSGIGASVGPEFVSDSKFSISMWFKFSSAPSGTDNRMFNFRSSGGLSRLYVLFDTVEDAFLLWAKPSTPIGDEYTISTTGQSNVGSWTHLVATCGGVGGYLKLYINGTDVTNRVFQLVSAIDSSIGLSTDCLGNAGDTGGDTSSWAGSIDATAMWNKELTQTEVTELYNSGTGKEYPY
jgi:hypothetical protein